MEEKEKPMESKVAPNRPQKKAKRVFLDNDDLVTHQILKNALESGCLDDQENLNIVSMLAGCERNMVIKYINLNVRH